MKNELFLMITLIFSTQVFGVSHDECAKFGKEVLAKAIFEDPKASDNEYPFRFIKDEKTAVEYLKKFDVKKLNFSEKKAQQEEETKYYLANNCDQKLFDKKFLFCESFGFASRDFFVGLIYGMKNYSWSNETILLGKQKLWDYLNGASEYSTSSINLLISLDVARTLGESKLVAELNPEEFNEVARGLEMESSKFREEKDQKKRCEIYKKDPKAQSSIAQKYGLRFKKILAQWKKP